LDCEELNVFPNPCKDFFYIELQADAEISIYNGIGQLVLKTIVKVGEPVDVSKLKNGIYVTFIVSKGFSNSGKLTIQ